MNSKYQMILFLVLGVCVSNVISSAFLLAPDSYKNSHRNPWSHKNARGYSKPRVTVGLVNDEFDSGVGDFGGAGALVAILVAVPFIMMLMPVPGPDGVPMPMMQAAMMAMDPDPDADPDDPNPPQQPDISITIITPPGPPGVTPTVMPPLCMEDPCPAGYTTISYNNNCYKFYSKSRKFESAKTRCFMDGANLWRTDNIHETRAVFSHVIPEGYKSVWTFARDETADSDFATYPMENGGGPLGTFIDVFDSYGCGIDSDKKECVQIWKLSAGYAWCYKKCIYATDQPVCEMERKKCPY